MSYETIEIEIDPELQDKMVEAYVLDNLSDPSIDVFYDNYSPSEGTIADQLYAAILNETLIKAINKEMVRLKELLELGGDENPE